MVQVERPFGGVRVVVTIREAATVSDLKAVEAAIRELQIERMRLQRS